MGNSYPAISSAFDHIMAGSICNNITNPYAESNGPVYPTFAEYITGVRPQGNFTPITNATAQVLLLGVGVGEQGTGPAASAISSNSNGSPVAVSTAAAPAGQVGSSVTTPYLAPTAGLENVSSDASLNYFSLPLVGLLSLLTVSLYLR